MFLRSIVIYILLFSNILFGYQFNNLDSLKNQLSNSENKEKLYLLLNISDLLFAISPEESSMYLHKGLEISKKNNDLYFKAVFLNALSGIESITGEFIKSAEHAIESKYIFLSLGYLPGVGSSLTTLGTLASYSGDNQRANNYFAEAQTYFDEEDYKYLSENINSYSGVIKDSVRFVIYDYATILNRSGNFYLDCSENFDESIELYKKAIESFKVFGNRWHVAGLLYNFASYYHTIEDYKNAINYLSQAEKLGYELNKESYLFALIELLFTNIYIDKNEIAKAEISIKRAEKISRNLNLQDLLGSIHFLSAIIYKKKGNSTSATEELRNCINLAKKNKSYGLILDPLEYISKLYEAENKLDSSLYYQRMLTSYKDTVYQLSEKKHFEDLKIRTALTKKEIEVEKLLKDKEFYKVQRIYGFVIILLILTLAVLLVLVNYKRKKTNNKLRLSESELKKSNEAKDKLFSVIAHDLKNPFMGILNSSNFLSSEIKNLSQENIANLAENINISTENLHNLLDNLLHWSILQKEGMTLKLESHNLSEISKHSTSLFSKAITNKKINFRNNIESVNAIVDRNIIDLVLRNLISNAVKFTKENGKIVLSSEKTDDSIDISVFNSGYGLTEKQIQNLFNDNNRVSETGTKNEKGTGIGLSLSKDFVEFSGGEIKVTSEINVGTTFTFTIPT